MMKAGPLGKTREPSGFTITIQVFTQVHSYVTKKFPLKQICQEIHTSMKRGEQYGMFYVNSCNWNINEKRQNIL